ncbi:MAG: pyrroline-5-carboxylate reductase [Betaproteobacteria bacterium]|nr:pyrroline-5-carboxylate reductase [Betaproteobacteria bacterium]
MKIAFLGGGNMAGALIGGLLAKGYSTEALSVVEVVPEARANLMARYKVDASAAPDDATFAADTLVLAVKPQDMRQAVASLSGRLERPLVISIAAGIRLADLSRWLGGYTKLVRVMPNTPALIGAGIAGLYARPEVNPEERSRAESILGAVGKTVWVEDEALIDPVTAISGSGPAYVFYFIEALERAGVELGLAPQTARTLAIQTFVGAARLAAENAEPPSVLRERVTSKGGTTEAALKVFAAEDLAGRIGRALKAASNRGEELGRLLGKDE